MNSENNTIFADGIFFKLPHEKAPDFVKGKISIKVEDAVKFLQEYADNGWVNVNLKVSRVGKPYAELDTWKPDSGYNNQSSGHVPPDAGQDNGFDDTDGIPF